MRRGTAQLILRVCGEGFVSQRHPAISACRRWWRRGPSRERGERTWPPAAIARRPSPTGMCRLRRWRSGGGGARVRAKRHWICKKENVVYARHTSEGENTWSKPHDGDEARRGTSRPSLACRSRAFCSTVKCPALLAASNPLPICISGSRGRAEKGGRGGRDAGRTDHGEAGRDEGDGSERRIGEHTQGNQAPHGRSPHAPPQRRRLRGRVRRRCPSLFFAGASAHRAYVSPPAARGGEG